MYNLLIALGITLGVFALISAAFGSPVAGILPAVMVGGLALVLLLRRNVAMIQADTADIPALLDPSTIKSESDMRARFAQVDAKLVKVKEKWQWWQFLLAAQIDGQRGMLRYAQKDFDAAYPLLEAGKWRDANVHGALACIHWRRGEKDKVWPLLDEAGRLAGNDVTVFLLRGVLLHEAGRDKEALDVLTAALKEVPGNEALTRLRDDIANKRKIERKDFPQQWLQFFPEDAPLIMGPARPQAANGPMRGFRGFSPEQQVPLPEKLNRAQRRSEERKK